MARRRAAERRGAGRRRAGDAGRGAGGVGARSARAYALWGDAVSRAYRVRSVTGEPGSYVSQGVRDRLRDSVTFTEAGTVELRGKTQSVWLVQ